ncbi:MAG: hypothetical protein IJB08_06295 [Alistipes sp.]|nr:hypothetical protein [Alistipes sp.]
MNLSINLHNYAFGVISDKSGIIVVYLKKNAEKRDLKRVAEGHTALSKKAGLMVKKREIADRKNANRIFQTENRFTKYLHNQNY